MSAVCTHPSAVVTQFTILQPQAMAAELYTESRLPTGAFTPPTRLNSTVASRRRCVLGFIKSKPSVGGLCVVIDVGHLYQCLV